MMEGIFMHELGVLKIRYFLGEIEEGKFNELLEKMKLNKFYHKEIDDAVNVYVDLAVKCITEARSKAKDAAVYVEKKLDLSRWVPDGYGTCDAVIAAGGVLQIIDFNVEEGAAVEAENNLQIKMYGLGALDLLDELYDIDIVRMTICQPRLNNISTWVMSAEKLEEWAEEELKPRAEMAAIWDGQSTAGELCRAGGSCRERGKTAVGYGFRQAALITDEEVEKILPLSQKLAAWASDVYSHAVYLTIFRGRKYKDIYKKSLTGMQDMEKFLGKKNFNIILGDIEVKPAEKPALVPEDDKRDASEEEDLLS
jgi:hypothetical protein